MHPDKYLHFLHIRHSRTQGAADVHAPRTPTITRPLVSTQTEIEWAEISFDTAADDGTLHIRHPSIGRSLDTS